MTQIKIEVPANDTIALSALGKALQLIASERATLTVSGGDSLEETFQQAKHTLATINDMVDDGTLIRPDQEIETEVHLGQTVNELHTQVDEASVELPEVTEQVTPPATEVDDTLDADGLPWDKRIHSRGKSRLADNTWRLARKPADKSQDEWNEYVETVKAELKAVQSIAPPEADDQPATTVEDITQVEIDAGNLPPVETGPFYWSHDESDSCGKVGTLDELHKMIDGDGLVNQISKESYDKRIEIGYQSDEAVLPPVETVAPPVVETPPVETVAPPVVETPPVEAPSNAPSVTTFPELMKWITSVAKKRGADNDMIKAVLADIDPALAGLPLLATRADLIPTFVTKLEERLS